MGKQSKLHQNKKKKYVIAALCIAIPIVIIALLYRPVSEYLTIKNDRDRIASELYDTVFLSMFPTDNFSEQDFTEYREQYALKTAYTIPDMETLNSYMADVTNSLNTVSTAYLGILPEAIAGEELIALTEEYPYIHYNIILPYPSMDYWLKLSDEEVENTLKQYRDLCELLLTKSNIRTFLFSKEWLICNPGNYDDTFLTNESISATLMLNCDELHNYYISPENIDDTFEDFEKLLEVNRSTPTVYPDLSDYKIVFFGDSIIGTFTDSSSVPGVVNGLTDATTYNCAQPGYSASIHPDGLLTLPDIVNAFISQNTSSLSEDTQVLKGFNEYLQDNSKTKKLCFVINYGLNDYFNGAPVSTEDPYDPASYKGALLTAVEALQQTYPDAQIILATPNFTSYYDNGQDAQSEVGGVLSDYADAVASVGTECNVTVLDNFTELGINADNVWDYLPDGCHPNEATRYLMGQRIIQAIE